MIAANELWAKILQSLPLKFGSIFFPNLAEIIATSWSNKPMINEELMPQMWSLPQTGWNLEVFINFWQEIVATLMDKIVIYVKLHQKSLFLRDSLTLRDGTFSFNDYLKAETRNMNRTWFHEKFFLNANNEIF